MPLPRALILFSIACAAMLGWWAQVLAGPVDLHGDPLPAEAAARFGTVRFRHQTGVTSLSLSPDGKQVATTDQGPAVSVWDAATGKRLRLEQSKGSSGRWAIYRRDGKLLVLENEGQLLRLRELDANREL